MSNILNLVLKVTGETSGVKLSPVERALESLGKQVENTTKLFEPFAEQSAAAARAQEDFGNRFAALSQQLQDKAIGAKEYTEAFAALREEAKQAVEVFKEGAETTAKFATEQDKAVDSLDTYAQQLRAGAIDADTFSAAVAEAFDIDLDASEKAAELVDTLAESVASGTGTIEDYADAMRDAVKAQEDETAAAEKQAELQKRATEIIQEQKTALDEFNDKQRELQELLEAGVLPLENYTAAIREAAAGLSGADLAAASESSGVALEAVSEGATAAADSTQLLQSTLGSLPGFLGQFADTAINVLTNATQLSERITDLGSAFGRFTSAIPSFTSAVRVLATPIGALAAGITISGAVAVGLSRLEGEVQRLQNTANKLGVSFAFIETLQQAARITGVSFEQVNSATTRLLRSLANADERSQKASKALASIGVSLETLDRGNTEETIKAIADRLAAIESPAQRATAAVAIFGKSGAELLPFLESLGEAERTLDRFNARISETDVKRILDLGSSFNDVGAALRGIGNEALTPFIGVAKGIADGLAPALAEFGKIAGNVLDILSPLLSVVGLFGNALGQVAGVILNVFNVVLAPLAKGFREIASGIDFASKYVTFFFRQITGGGQAAKESLRQSSSAANELSKAIKDALAKGNEALDGAIEKAGQFGQSGFAAALSFQTAVQQLGQALKDDDIGAAEYAKRLEAAKRQFEEQLELVKGVRGELIRIEEEKKARISTDTQIADQIIKENEALREQLELQALLGGSQSRAKALQNVQSINREIARLEENAAKARKDNDLDALAAIENRVTQLKEARGLEQTIADGGRTALQLEQERLQKIEEQAKLVEDMLKKNKEQTELEKQLAALEAERAKLQDTVGRERFRMEDELRRLAEDSSLSAEEYFKRSAEIRNNAQLAQAEQRLADVEKLRADLDEQQQAIEMGYSEGFDKAFASMNEGFEGLIDKASQFGNAGAQAAATFQEFVSKAQEDARLRGIAIDQDALARARAEFEQRLGQLEEVRKREIQGQKDIFDAKVQAANRVDAFLKEQIEGRKQAEIAAEDAIEKRKREAALNVQAIEERLAVERNALKTAREAGELDLDAARAAQERIKALQQALKLEKDIVKGKLEGQKQFQEQVLADQRAAAEQQAKLQEELYRQEQQRQEQRNNVLNDIAARRQQEFEQDAQRVQELATIGPRAIQGIDLRTQQGADLVLGLELNRQDPNLIEQRIQTKLLQQIADGIIENVVRNINAPVSIVGMARLN